MAQHTEEKNNMDKDDTGGADMRRPSRLSILIAMAGAFMASSFRSSVFDDPRGDLTGLSVTLTPIPLPPEQDKTHAQVRYFKPGNVAQYRQAQTNLAAFHHAAAKWHSGAVHVKGRSHENRHAERQRNWATYNR